ncbi:RNA-directed DNA polymerase, eukaryota, reverse transcriptase zinc-binding domain protein [Tanacetum coccineum]
MEFKMATWNIRGMNTSEKQKEVKKFINEEKLHLCAVIETHIKYAKIKKVDDFVYGNWEYVTNSENNNKGCRIMVGWDPNMIQVWMLGKEKQWDFNVTLNVNEHSNGSSVSSADMIDFQKCVAELEIEDILKKEEFYPTVMTEWNKDVEDKNPFDDTIKKQICEVLREYTKAARDEENLMIQKAKEDWLKGGDKNTDFFHKIIKGKIHKRRVMSICDENGIRYENEKVAEQFEKHFKKFLGTKDEVCAFPSGCIMFNNKPNSDEAMRMVRPVTDEEIRDEMFDIDDSKAPGKLLGEVNVTLISLVPKIPTPSKVSDFRPEDVKCSEVVKCTGSCE